LRSHSPRLFERLLYRIARRWVAGYSADGAVEAALDANRRGMSAILNFLGEEVAEMGQVQAAVSEYLALMDLLREKNVWGCVSVKPTQLGLAVDYDTCLNNFKMLAARAKTLGQFMWLDMESARYTEQTIAIYLELLKDYGDVGIAVQASLRRSGSDLLHIIERGGKVRLVKGAYRETPGQAFASKHEVDRNYSQLLRTLATSGNFFAVATHDEMLVEQAIGLGGRFEFQMLRGIRDELKARLVAGGFAVAEYIPYGNQWLPYSMRRLRERKRNLLLLVRSLFQR
jgi:proline dehydrogenase